MKKKELKKIDKINEMQRSIDHINIMTVSPEIDSMSDVITEVNPKIVVVDTIDAIRVNYKNDSILKTEKNVEDDRLVLEVQYHNPNPAIPTV